MNKFAAFAALSIGFASVSSLIWASPVSALSFTEGGSTYAVIVEETTFDDLRGREGFEDLVPWFGDEDLARTIATAASDAFIGGNEELGVPGGFFGPFFAFGIDTNGSIDFTTYINNEGRLENAGKINSDKDTFYAVVDLDFSADGTAAVPSPALLPGLAGLGLAAIRKRNQA